MYVGPTVIKWKRAEEKFVLSFKCLAILMYGYVKVRPCNVLRHTLHKIQSSAAHSGRFARGVHIRWRKAGWGTNSA